MVCVFTAACDTEARTDFRPVTGPASRRSDARPQYRFGVAPLRPTGQICIRYSQLVSAVNRSLDHCEIHLESALTNKTYLEKFRRAELDVVLAEPHQVLAAEKLGYTVFARTGAQDRISGAVITRRDAHIHSIRDLRSKTLYFGSPDALASTMLVRMWLRRAGFEPSDSMCLFTGSAEAALLEIYYGGGEAAGASLRAWQDFVAAHPDAEQVLEARWKTNGLSGPALMAHERVPVSHIAEIAQGFDALDQSSDGREALQKAGYSEFRRADASAYDDVWELTNEYARHFANSGGGGL